MITKESKLLGGWNIPRLRKSGRAFPGDMKVNFKYGTIFLNPKFVRTKLVGILKPDEQLKGAFRLVPDEKPFVVFDPVQGIPFYVFRRSKDGKASSVIQNSDLVKQVAERFGLNKETPATNFELVPFERMNGMMYFQMVQVQTVQKNIEFKG